MTLSNNCDSLFAWCCFSPFSQRPSECPRLLSGSYILSSFLGLHEIQLIAATFESQLSTSFVRKETFRRRKRVTLMFIPNENFYLFNKKLLFQLFIIEKKFHSVTSLIERPFDFIVGTAWCNNIRSLSCFSLKSIRNPFVTISGLSRIVFLG